MEQCVIGVFESSREASVAKDNLRSGGFADSTISEQQSDAPSLSGDEGGISGFFARLFGIEEHPHVGQYSNAIDRGHAVLIVDAGNDDEADRARFIMERAGAFDVEARSQEWMRDSDSKAMYDTSSANPTAPRFAAGTMGSAGAKSGIIQPSATAARATEKIPVVEEELHVGKREVERGRVRIYTRVIEKPVEESVNLKEQQVLVERHPVERVATAEDWAKLRDREFELRTVVEEPVVQKTARVIEEVEVGRRTTEHTETVRDTVRRTDVEVDEIDELQKPEQPARKPKRSTEKRQTM